MGLAPVMPGGYGAGMELLASGEHSSGMGKQTSFQLGCGTHQSLRGGVGVGEEAALQKALPGTQQQPGSDELCWRHGELAPR